MYLVSGVQNVCGKVVREFDYMERIAQTICQRDFSSPSDMEDWPARQPFLIYL